MGLFDKLKEGLQKTRKSITERVDGLFKSFSQIDEELFEELEEILIMADVGVNSTQKIIDNLKQKVKTQRINEPSKLKGILKEEIKEILTKNNTVNSYNNKPTVILVVGVNGVGKTTSIGKLAYRFKNEGKKVLIAAADTFRAAAIDQLEVWAKRVGCEIIRQSEGADPAAVVFDAIKSLKARDYDILIVDTAGRLHTKKNLVEELKKIDRVIKRELPDALIENLLVVDATTGQNALIQAKEFHQAVNLTGVVLTKLDGTAKGGIIIPICEEVNVPVKFIGIGEGIDHLQEFDPEEFVNALFD